MISPNTGSETNSKLPFSFIFFSLLSLVLSQIVLLGNGQFMSYGSFRIPPIWSAAHFLILGWALMVAMGAMYQLVPVAFLTAIWSEAFGYIQFATTAIGIISFAGVLYLSPQNAMIPGILTFTGIFMFLFQMAMTLRKQAKPTILTAFIGTALLCLFLTIIIGLTMVYCLKTGVGASFYQSIFQTHLLMGLVGWFTLLIFGFSYKMVPMFSLSHGYPMVHARYVYGIYLSGIVITAVSFFTNQSALLKLGFFLLLTGFSFFSYHIRLIIQKRLKKKLDIPFRFSLLAIFFGNIIHLAVFLLLWTSSFSELIGPMLYSYLLLWIVLSILGYLYKIVPFLWWTYKYSKEMGKQSVPTLKQMINDKIISPLFIIFIVSALAVFFSLTFQITALFNVGQMILSIVLILITINILSVISK